LKKTTYHLIGPSGCGKGTATYYAISYFERLGVFVCQIIMSTALDVLGKIAQKFKKDNKNVPAGAATSTAMREHSRLIAKLGFFPKDLVKDGHCRDPNQATEMFDFERQMGYEPVVILFDNLTEEDCLKRITGRVEKALSEGKTARDDDQNIEGVKRKLKHYFDILPEILEEVEKNNVKIYRVDAGQSKQKVADDVVKIMLKHIELSPHQATANCLISEEPLV
jgi:adenylate kinase family enzyme